ncbi:MAG: PqqD family protein [Sphingomonadales bacterium]|nr:MAG: PqqD family protein [Sphingomonadales bacterium]
MQSVFQRSDMFVRNDDALVSAEVDGELVGLSVEKGVCYGLNAVGTRIWALLETPRSLDDLCAQLTDIFDVEPERCEREVVALLGELRSEGLVTVVPA